MATLNLQCVLFDYTHKYYHFTHSWTERDGVPETSTFSALVDVTDMSPPDRATLRLLLADDTIAQCCVDFIVGYTDTCDVSLIESDRKVLEASKWCSVPPSESEDNIIQIVSFIS